MRHPDCPLCVRRTCANCYGVDQQINRKWLELHCPDGECRFCGASREAVTERPVRHTNRLKYEAHLKAANTVPPERLVRDPIAVAEALDLIATLDSVFFAAYNGARHLPRDDNRDRYVPEDVKARNWNDGTEKLFALVTVVRRWNDDNPASSISPDIHRHDFVNGTDDRCTGYPACRLMYQEYAAQVQEERDRG